MKAIKEFLKLKINWLKTIIVAVVIFLILAGFVYYVLLGDTGPV